MSVDIDVSVAQSSEIVRLHNLIKSYVIEADTAKSEEWPAVEVARTFINVRALLDAIHDIVKPLTAIKERLAYEDVPAAFEREGSKTITLKEGFRVTISALVRASCRDMGAAIAWMDEHGHEGIPKKTINAQTLAAFAKAEMEEGRELPDEIFNIHVGSNTSVTKL